MDRIRAALIAFVVLIASASSADWSSIYSSQVVHGGDQSVIRHEWTSAATDSTAYNISACTSGVEGRFDPSTGDSSTDATFQFRMCKVSTATAPYCRPISWPGPSDGSTWVGLNAKTSDENYILADALTATAGGDTARVEVRCFGDVTTRQDSGGSLIQSTPSIAADSDSTTARISDPAVVKFGWGVTTEASPPGFSAKTYPGGSTDGSEPDHQMGWFYNKAGIGSSTIPNRFEHSVDKSVETSYRSTGGTGDETWMEENIDIVPPDFSAPTTSSNTTGWVANDVLTFSGGGTGRLLSVSGSDPTKTIVWRMDHGTTAAGETVSNVTHATSAATLGTLTPNGTTWRSFLWVLQTLNNTTSWNFYDRPNQSTPTLGVSSGYVKTNGNVVVSGTASDVYGPTFWAISNGGSFDTGTEVCSQNGFTCVDVLEFSTPATPTDSACGTTNSNTVKFLAMCK